MKFFLIPVFVFAFFTTGCFRENHTHFRVELETDTSEISSRTPVELKFQVKKPTGEKTSELEIVHEKPMHLFIVSRDLAQYFHEHPVRQKDGTYKLDFEFPNGGDFRIYLDFKPPNEEILTESFDVSVKGQNIPEVELKPDEKFEKTIDGLRFTLKPNRELKKHSDLLLEFQVSDASTNAPVENLQNYLGAKAHFVIIRKNLGRFIHGHPVSGENSDKTMDHRNMPSMPMNHAMENSKVAAAVNFPNSGIYKIFAQFKYQDKIYTVPFVFEVKG